MFNHQLSVESWGGREALICSLPISMVYIPPDSGVLGYLFTFPIGISQSYLFHTCQGIALITIS